jgi:DNA polymerase-1
MKVLMMSSIFSEISKKLKARKERLDKSHRDSRVLIIDGMNIFIRAFSSNPKLDSNGNHIGGIVGFLQTIGILITNIDPTRVVIVFDGKGGSIARKQMYSEYKSNRSVKTRFNRVEGMEDMTDEDISMKNQLLCVSELLINLPITTISIDYVEADDVISYLANYFKEEVFIASNDRDFLQLVSERVSVYSPSKKIMFTPTSMLEYTGVWCENYALFKALVGDKSDNIKSVKGFGEKTALKAFPQLSYNQKFDMESLRSFVQDYTGSLAAVHRLQQDMKSLELNYDLVQLSETNISSSALSKIRFAVDSDVDILNKISIDVLARKMNIKDSFNTLDDWINRIFLTLSSMRNKRKSDISESDANG